MCEILQACQKLIVADWQESTPRFSTKTCKLSRGTRDNFNFNLLSCPSITRGENIRFFYPLITHVSIFVVFVLYLWSSNTTCPCAYQSVLHVVCCLLRGSSSSTDAQLDDTDRYYTKGPTYRPLGKCFCKGALSGIHSLFYHSLSQVSVLLTWDLIKGIRSIS